jgi:hypothetical protein
MANLIRIAGVSLWLASSVIGAPNPTNITMSANATVSANTTASANITNPISVKSAEIIGNHTSGNDVGTYRDGGWQGQIGDTYFQVYADTLHCTGAIDSTSSNCENSAFRPNSLALSTEDPLVVTDFATPLPATLCESPVSGYRLHLTDMISLSNTTGVVFYSNISNDRAIDLDGAEIGSGIGIVTYKGSGSVPTCEVKP